MKDYINTILILGIMSLVVIGLGSWLLGRDGLWIAFIFVMVLNVVAYFFSEQIALKASKAVPLSETEAPEVYRIVRDLSQKMNIPMPDLYVTASTQANAFATGRNPKNSSVAVTSGIMSLLSQSELEGVLAHELAHIKNRDILTASVAAVLASFITFVSRMRYFNNQRSSLTDIIIMISAPIAGLILQMAISREREYVADATAAELLGSGDSLADALIKIESSVSKNKMSVNPAYTNLYIQNPIKNMSKISKLFSSHPPTASRVERLRAIQTNR